jgi:predicted nucleic acid-binding protein
MIILDTNVVSAAMRDDVEPRIRAWLDDRPPESIWLTSITVFEIRFGIQILAEGRKRRQLESDFARALTEDFEGRVLDFDNPAAEAAAAFSAQRKLGGRPMELRDTLIAGIVVSRRAELATRNVRHFEDLDISVINPWSS